MIPESGRSPGGGHGTPLQYPSLENPWTEEPGGLQSMWLKRVGYTRATTCSCFGNYQASLVAQVVENLPVMGSIPGSGRFPWRKEMATHSSILFWRIPLTGEPVGIQFMGSQRVGHD